MSSKNSPKMNNLIKSSERKRYISTLEQKLGEKGTTRTPIHHKIMDKYEDITSNISRKNMIIFFSMFIVICVVLYYFKPRFVLAAPKINEKSLFKISSRMNEDKRLERNVSYFKLLLYSMIITIILFSILYFMRNKSSYVAKLFA